MKSIVTSAAAALMLAGCAAQGMEGEASEQARLAEALAGRTAGEPLDCVNLRDLRGNRSYGEDVILFEGPTNSLVYVNRPPGGCPSLDGTRALRIEMNYTRLCRGQIVSVFDPATGVEYGGCGLGDFVPYRR